MLWNPLTYEFGVQFYIGNILDTATFAFTWHTCEDN